ncbi:MAG: hypothetical protein ACTTG8_04520 [Catonella sp.]
MGSGNEGGKEFIMNTEILNYLELMTDSLVKKERVLSSILELTRMQETLLSEQDFDNEKFDELISEKSGLIEEINKLDEGFDFIYKRISDTVKGNPSVFKEKIEKLQELIRVLVDRGVEIETLERRNQIQFDIKVSKSKDRIRNYNLNSSAVTKYYSNMSGNTGESNYFLDKKK